MKIKKHLNILKQWSDITNQLILESNILKIVASDGSLFSYYQWNEQIENRIGIYDLKQFAQIVSTFNDPDILFKNIKDDKYIIEIKENKRLVEYLSSPLEAITYEEKNVKEDLLNEKFSNVTFEMDNKLLSEINKMKHIIDSRHIIIKQLENNLKIVLCNFEDSSSNKFEIEVENYEGKINQNNIIYADSFNFLSGDYKVVAYDNCMLALYHKNNNLKYFVTNYRTK